MLNPFEQACSINLMKCFQMKMNSKKPLQNDILTSFAIASTILWFITPSTVGQSVSHKSNFLTIHLLTIYGIDTLQVLCMHVNNKKYNSAKFSQEFKVYVINSKHVPFKYIRSLDH